MAVERYPPPSLGPNPTTPLSPAPYPDAAVPYAVCADWQQCAACFALSGLRLLLQPGKWLLSLSLSYNLSCMCRNRPLQLPVLLLY